MKDFSRTNPFYSLCGLNCGLCGLKIGGYCPGCGGGEGNQSCAIARCALSRGMTDYCLKCDGFPCEKYEGFDRYDSFISPRHWKRDAAAFRALGEQAYNGIQREKAALLTFLLDSCNDGRHKTFYLLAVNLLPLEELREAIAKVRQHISSPAALSDENAAAGDGGAVSPDAGAAPPDKRVLTERAAYAEQLLAEIGQRQGVTLKLNKKPPREKQKANH